MASAINDNGVPVTPVLKLPAPNAPEHNNVPLQALHTPELKLPMYSMMPITRDRAYNEYLHRTLGRSLAEVIADMIIDMPRDPVDYIAQALYKIAQNELYHHEVLKFCESMVKQRKKMIRDQHRLKEQAYLVDLETTALNMEYDFHRRAEMKLNKWLAKHGSLLEMAEMNRLIQLARQENETASSPSSKINLQQIKLKAAAFRKQTTAQLDSRTEKHRRDMMNEKNSEDGRRLTLSEPNRFRSMVRRMQNAHEKSARGSIASSESKKSAYFSQSTAHVSKKSSKSQHSTKTSAGSGSPGTPGKFDINKFPAKWPLDFPFDDQDDDYPLDMTHDIEGCQSAMMYYAKVQAKRELYQTMIRGYILDDEDAAKVFTPRHWTALGVIPPIGDDMCNERTMQPCVWQEEKYDCRVFYDPEIYTCFHQKPKKPKKRDDGTSGDDSYKSNASNYHKPTQPAVFFELKLGK